MPGVVEKDRELRRRTQAPRGGRRRAEPSLELHLEPADAGWHAEDEVGGISREALASALIDDTVTAPSGDEWLVEEQGIRIFSTGSRVVIELAVRGDDREQLSTRLDHAYDLAFDLSRALKLDVVDPQLQQVVTRPRYESQFPRILDASYRRARILDTLRSSDGWRHCADAPLPESVPLVSAELSSLPASVWSKVGKPIGVLELEGDEIATALKKLDDSPFLAFGFGDGGPVAVIRVLRFATPFPGTNLVDAVSGGMHRATEAIECGARLAVLGDPRGTVPR